MYKRIMLEIYVFSSQHQRTSHINKNFDLPALIEAEYLKAWCETSYETPRV